MAKDFTVVLKSIKAIRPYEKNPRTIPSLAVDAVAKSIETFGFRQPIVVDAHDVIIVGHTRYRAALKLGIEEVPVHYALDLTPEQAQAYRIADNSSNTLSDWDVEILRMELGDLPGFDFEQFGLDLDILTRGHEAADDNFDLDAAAAAIQEPITQPGDIWVLGRHRLLCGDATVAAAVDRLMDGKRADMVWTDPPYNVAYDVSAKNPGDAPSHHRPIANDSMTEEQFTQFLNRAFAAALAVTRQGGAIYVAHADSTGEQFRRAFREAGWMMKQCLVWIKDSFVMGRQDYQWQHEPILYGWKPGGAHSWFSNRSQTTVLQFDRPKRSIEHPTMKPVPLVGNCIANSSKRGNAVLDSFGGSGTTLVACEQLERDARLLELDPLYCDVIVQRYERLTGGKAKREEALVEAAK